MSWPWNRSQRSLNVIVNDTDRSATYDFLLTFYIVTVGLARTVSEIDGDFCLKLEFSHPPPVYFAPPLSGFPLELGTGARG